MVELLGICKRYGATAALDEVTLRVPRAHTLVLIGSSGCGKSTLLRVAVGVVRPDRGAVRIGGEELEPARADLIRRRIGYVIQDGGLFPHLTAAENVSLLGRTLGWDAARLRRRLDELALLVRLDPDLLPRYPLELSGGQRQRVALMRALLLDPDVLLLDEPLGALDPIVRAELQDDLRRVFRTLSKSVLLVTHDLAEAAHFADTVALLRDGRVVQEGAVADLVERPAEDWVRRFVGAQRRTLGLGGEAS